MKCQHCKKKINHKILDLGHSPHSNAYIKEEDLKLSEKKYPLTIWVCNSCWLVQTEIFNVASDLFNSEYSYFSGTSTSWLDHSYKYTELISKKLNLNNKSFVIEIASNDGYLLKNFVNSNIPCLGIEPTEKTANESKKYGIDVIEEFFTEKLANQLSLKNKKADLLIGNNVFAHVPNINDFTNGMKIILKNNGTITLEFPHILNLIQKNQFDTIYHEHFSYLSLFTAIKIFNSAGLKVYDVEQLKTHGGSLRIYGCHQDHNIKISDSVRKILNEEKESDLQNIDTYLNLQDKMNKIKNDFLGFLNKLKRNGLKVAGFGAAAKANTIMNYAGVTENLLPFVCDSAIAKQGKYMPGSRIPIVHPSKLNEYMPDYIIIFPWNIKSEIVTVIKTITNKPLKFVTIIPELKVS